jgi:hypothetical protein
MSLMQEMETHGLADCEMNKNLDAYYCNGFWFAHYSDARRYAEFLLEHKRLYRVVYTRSEMDAHAAEVTA